MSILHDEIEIEDMEWDEKLQSFTYQCPCGDLFQITLEDLIAGEEIAPCPSCTLYIRVIYDHENFLAESSKESMERPPPSHTTKVES